MRARRTLLVVLATLGLVAGVMPAAHADTTTDTYIVQLKKTISASAVASSLGSGRQGPQPRPHGDREDDGCQGSRAVEQPQRGQGEQGHQGDGDRRGEQRALGPRPARQPRRHEGPDVQLPEHRHGGDRVRDRLGPDPDPLRVRVGAASCRASTTSGSPTRTRRAARASRWTRRSTRPTRSTMPGTARQSRASSSAPSSVWPRTRPSSPCASSTATGWATARTTSAPQTGSSPTTCPVRPRSPTSASEGPAAI